MFGGVHYQCTQSVGGAAHLLVNRVWGSPFAPRFDDAHGDLWLSLCCKSLKDCFAPPYVLHVQVHSLCLRALTAAAKPLSATSSWST